MYVCMYIYIYIFINVCIYTRCTGENEQDRCSWETDAKTLRTKLTLNPKPRCTGQNEQGRCSWETDSKTRPGQAWPQGSQEK